MSDRNIYCPSPEFLNLCFGVVVSLPIGIFSTLALADDTPPCSTTLSLITLAISSVAIGALALTSGQIRDEAMLLLGATLTAEERRAELQELTKERAVRVLVLETVALGFLVGGLVLLLA